MPKPYPKNYIPNELEQLEKRARPLTTLQAVLIGVPIGLASALVAGVIVALVRSLLE